MAATAFVSTPRFVVREGDNVIRIALVLRDVNSASGTVSLSFLQNQSTVTNNSDVIVPNYSGSYNVTISQTADYVINLPEISIFDDIIDEDTETFTVRIQASGRVFDNGTDTTTLSFTVEDNDLIGTDGIDTLTGSTFADYIDGRGGNDRLFGGSGNDTILGGAGSDRLDGGSGADRMSGGLGNDVYVVDSTGDVVVEDADGGDADAVESSISYTLGASIEDLILLGSESLTGTGNDLNNSIFGNSAANLLNGLDGADRLFGLGGDDILIGGSGIDTAYFSGLKSGYSLVYQGNGRVSVVGPDGNDRLEGVERLSFDGPGGVQTFTVPTSFFASSVTQASSSFGADPSAGGWTQGSVYPRMTGDVNGDGRADLVGFGGAGVFAALADGNGGFGSAYQASSLFGADLGAGGWLSVDAAPRTLGDINGDGRDDLIGFGGAGVFAALADGNGGFGSAYFAKNSFGSDLSAGGWASNKAHPRLLGDINGDGRDDLVGFGGAGVFAALADGNGGFGSAYLSSTSFGADLSAGGWTNNDASPRLLADVNGDGRDDLVGFGGAGVFAALADGNGGFGAAYLASSSFGADPGAGGWASQTAFPRQVADINGDGRADLVGFGGSGVYVALGQSDGRFAAPVLDVGLMGQNASAGGWTDNDKYPRMLADTNADGRADLIGFGNNGVFVATASDFFALG
ncbi:hypothetical protein HJG53_16985 [Sphingomonas sp. ID1715]|uniref:FG-GAP-like repeat-containing protein n=1 Tax=Sphingomonas sp. ID1715 TaxID=1656898 RepID=UPI00148895E3|nr:FG-GAP-like repeat-containing protein [Sphingomonas sp. ID1715]NNM78585.1 hypothetical protein [Sphingomonas sp. ID1715]